MLRVDNASVYFSARDGRPVHVLDRVSLEIPERAFVVALGTSGCGKSTLLNAMAGFLPLSSGSITLNGHEVTGPGAERGVVFQKDALLPWKNVVENVALGLKFAGIGRKERRERAVELLRLVGLQDFAADPDSAGCAAGKVVIPIGRVRECDVDRFDPAARRVNDRFNPACHRAVTNCADSIGR